MLLQIRDYMRRVKIASNKQLAREFKIDIAAIQPMLDCWKRKGILIIYGEKKTCQSSCFTQCQSTMTIYYQFVE